MHVGHGRLVADSSPGQRSFQASETFSSRMKCQGCTCTIGLPWRHRVYRYGYTVNGNHSQKDAILVLYSLGGDVDVVALGRGWSREGEGERFHDLARGSKARCMHCMQSWVLAPGELLDLEGLPRRSGYDGWAGGCLHFLPMFWLHKAVQATAQ